MHPGDGEGLQDGSGVGTASELVVKFTSSTWEMPPTLPVAISWRISFAVIGQGCPLASWQSELGWSLPWSRAFRAAL